MLNEKLQEEIKQKAQAECYARVRPAYIKGATEYAKKYQTAQEKLDEAVELLKEASHIIEIHTFHSDATDAQDKINEFLKSRVG